MLLKVVVPGVVIDQEGGYVPVLDYILLENVRCRVFYPSMETRVEAINIACDLASVEQTRLQEKYVCQNSL